MDRSQHAARSIGAEPHPLAVRRTEACIMKDLGTWHDKLYRTLQTPRGDRRQDRLHLQRVLLAEATADIRRDDLDLVGCQAERRHDAVPDGFSVLRATSEE